MTTTSKNAHFVAVVNAIEAFVARNEIKLVPQAQTIDGVGGNKNWACYQLQSTENKIYVPRAGQGPLHTTVRLPEGFAGLANHMSDKGVDRREGKIEHWVTPAALPALLEAWAGTTDRLRAAKAPVRRPASGTASPAASQAPAVDARQAEQDASEKATLGA